MKWHLKTSKWNGTYAAVLLVSHATLYTTFDNPMPKPSCQKSRKTRITEKVLLVIQSSSIVHYDQHMQKPACADFQAFSNTFSLYKLTFFHVFFLPGKNTFFVVGWVQQTEKSKFEAKISHFVDFDWGRTHQNGLSGAYSGFKACWIQLHRFWISMKSGSWKIKISGKNFTFCWFLTGKNSIEMAWVEHI